MQTILFNVKLLAKIPVQLKIIQNENKFSFYYQQGEGNWQLAVKDFTGSMFGVENAGGFMGAFVGLYATSNGKSSSNTALFDWFYYK